MVWEAFNLSWSPPGTRFLAAFCLCPRGLRWPLSLAALESVKAGETGPGSAYMGVSHHYTWM